MSHDPVLVVEGLSFRYHSRPEPALRDISLTLKRGEILLVAGSSGCGKTTLARCINGLIPRSYGGDRKGNVWVNGQEVAQLSLIQVAQTIGTLLQDPERQIVASNVFSEIAFGPENLGLPRSDIVERIRRVACQLKIEHLLSRQTFQLSGGEKQKVALAGLLVMQPTLLLLDEPLASLDPASAAEVLGILRQLADEGVAILLVEHRVEDALMLAPDQLMYMEAGRVEYLGSAERFPHYADYHKVKLPASWVVQQVKANGIPQPPTLPPPALPQQEVLLAFEQVNFAYESDSPQILFDINLTIRRGEQIAILGPNGAGKSTLIKHAVGLLKPRSGRVLVKGQDTRSLSVAEVARTVGYVFQSPTHMLFAETVTQELAFGPSNLGFSPDALRQSVTASSHTLNLTGLENYSPLALSFGQQKRTTIASVLAMQSQILVMDEPTAGQDFANYTRFMDALLGSRASQASLASSHFAATLFITHDIDLALTYANRVLLFAEGRIQADGSPLEISQDLDTLQRCRLRPSSLLQLNLDLWPRTGSFLTAEALAAYVDETPFGG